MPLRRSRFSLRSLLLSTTIVALVFSIIQLGRELLPLREEVERLRAEAGHLVVDPKFSDRLQAIQVRNQTDKTWKWKVYLPAERIYKICTQWNKIPEEGVLPIGTSSSLRLDNTDAREMSIACAMRRSSDGKEWQLSIEVSEDQSTATSFHTLPPDCWEWIENSPGGSIGGVTIFEESVISDTPESLVLMRSREMVRKSPTVSQTQQGLADGFMIWIQEED